LEKRLKALSRVGLITQALPFGEYLFSAKNHPDMFTAVRALPWDNFGMLDFRYTSGTHKLTYEDYFISLFDQSRERAYQLHNFAVERKLRTSLNANGGVVYQYKSKQVMTIETYCEINRTLSVGVVAKDKNDSPAVIDHYLEKEPQEIREQALRHISGCDTGQCMKCSTFASGVFVTILGTRHQICGTGMVRYFWHEPTAEDMAVIKRLIDLRCESVTAGL
jgi:hypothetical protein